MLQVQHIKKDYKTGDLVQHALNDVSVNFRDNEFVAILGPSGSGKTTLLNVIGGLDRYDSGDLIINGVSTKKYKDRDWDSYRNHTIGFVFQSYNLIMHQTVLANVELALTISGISGTKRREKAKAALEKVGLADHMYKKPGQMSGGQMQRVAIARALVNDPDIVLADEPTGALDSDTSVQVMDFLQEVAKDRLVVMVTHNPELASEYATRTVTIKDGKILADTDPFEPDADTITPPVHRNLGRSSMSFLTALSLSFNNLKTKKARTILVSFAGSIGIIGIALILSLSTGVNRYIQYQESETLSEYPLQLQKTGFDLTGLMTSSSSGSMMSSGSSSGDSVEGKVTVAEVVEGMFGGVSVNNLGALKTYLESGDAGIEEYVRSIEYLYQVTPQIYQQTDDGVLQVNPSNLFEGISASDSSLSAMLSMSSSADFFFELPQNEQLYEETYYLEAGHWPRNENELVLVLGSGGRITDLVLYGIGMKDRSEIEDKLNGSISANGSTSASSSDSAESEAEESSLLQLYDYSDFLGMTFKLVNNSAFYVYDEEYEVWTDKSGNASYVEDLVENGSELVIAGIVQPKEGSAAAMLSTGIGYTHELMQHIMEEAAESEVVQAQLADPDINIFTGSPFGEQRDASEINLADLFTMDEDAFSEAFGGSGLDLSSLAGSMSGLNLDLSGMDFSGMDFSGMDLSAADMGAAGDMLDADALSGIMPSFTREQMNELLDEAVRDMTPEETEEMLQQMAADILNGYSTYIGNNTSADISKLGTQVQTWLQTEEAAAILQTWLLGVLESNQDLLFTQEQLQEILTTAARGFAASLMLSDAELPDLTQINGLAELLPLVQQYWTQFEEYLAASPELKEFREEVMKRLTSITVTDAQRTDLYTKLSDGYRKWAEKNGSPRVEEIETQFQSYLKTEEVQQILTSYASNLINTAAVTEKVMEILDETMNSVSDQLSGMISQMMTQIMTALTGQITSALQDSMQQLSSALTSALTASMGSMGDLFSMDPDMLADAVTFNMSVDEIGELLTSMLTEGTATLSDNLAALGYADESDPYEIDIYPVDFESKNKVTEVLDAYNQNCIDEGREDEAITYTDYVAAMMSSITRIIDTISYVLIAFVAISLVVSSIMIGVITYISVLERRKEIGVLRAIGASKNNVSQVFNAETFITGLLAGSIGILVTVALTFPINALIDHYINQEGLSAQLPAESAGVLIVLSVLLTMLAGLIPSGKAARSDPVSALRSD